MKVLLLLLIASLSSVNINAQGWVAYPSGTSRTLSAVYFTDWAKGWAVGDRVILLSQDSGLWWSADPFSANYSFSAIHVPDTILIGYHTPVYVVGYDWSLNKGIILKSTNSGYDWDINIAPYSEGVILESVHFVNLDTGWTVGQGKILKTTDGGNTWVLQRNGPETDWLRGIFFINSNLGWCVGYRFLAKTTNGGISWLVHPISSNYLLHSVHFIGQDLGWTCGANGRIIKTTDSGITWNSQSSGVTTELNSIYFTDSNYGWAVGDNGIILRTTDGGDSWIKFIHATQDRFSSVHFYNEELGWVVGSGNYVLRTTDGGITFINEDHPEVLFNFDLAQNYPNPFNPETQIEYSLSEPGFVTVSVFDIIGNKIADLVNEKQIVGTHNVTFNASELSSGLYFYSIKVNDFHQTKKMLLVK